LMGDSPHQLDGYRAFLRHGLAESLIAHRRKRCGESGPVWIAVLADEASCE
jgi:hypothetical protein